MAGNRGAVVLGAVCLLLMSLSARAEVGPTVPTPGLKQELDEGIAAWFLVAASSVTLSYDQQQTLINVRQEVSAKSTLVNAARQKLVGLVADGVASGTFDDKAIAATLQEMTAAAEARGPAVVDALMQLHAALTPDQRKSMAQTIAQGIASEAAQVQTERDQLQRRVKSLTADVGLTQEQSARVKSDILDGYKQFAPELDGEASTRQKQLGGLAQGFAQYYFQPTVENVASSWDLVAKSKRLIAFSRALTAILNPTQRTQVAALIRERVNYG
jgi:Spy/CpxP family protein refolding chaperone